MKGAPTSTPDLNNLAPDYDHLPATPPPAPADGMAHAAEAMGETGIDMVDAGGQPDLTMVNPDPERGAATGPLAAILRDRIAGSAQAIDLAGEAVTQRGDGAANARTQSGA